MGMVGIWAKLAATGGVAPRGERRGSGVPSGTFSEYRCGRETKEGEPFGSPLIASGDADLHRHNHGTETGRLGSGGPLVVQAEPRSADLDL